MPFDSFEKEWNAEHELCIKYSSILPQDLVNVWQEYGFGSLMDGYLRIINPDEYKPLLDDSYGLSSTAIPIFVTAFADIVTWSDRIYTTTVPIKNQQRRMTCYAAHQERKR